MTREEAHKVLIDLVEQISGTPGTHRQIWQAIETLAETHKDENHDVTARVS